MKIGNKNISTGHILKKLGEWFGVATAILTVVWMIGKPIVDDYLHERIHFYQKLNGDKKKLSEKLASEINVDPEEVHIVFGQMYNNLSSTVSDLSLLKEVYIPMLEDEAKNPRFGIVWHGDKELYNFKDGYHRVTIGEDGRRYWWNDNRWELVYK